VRGVRSSVVECGSKSVVYCSAVFVLSQRTAVSLQRTLYVASTTSCFLSIDRRRAVIDTMGQLRLKCSLIDTQQY